MAGEWRVPEYQNEEYAGHSCDNQRPAEWRLLPGQTYRMEIGLKLHSEFDTGPGDYNLAPIVIGGVGGEMPAPEPVQPPGGMVGWWPGDGNANDIIGGNHGIPISDFVEGMVQQGFGLDGISDYILVPDNNGDLNITGDVTVDLWAKRDAFGAHEMISKSGIGEQGNSGDAFDMWFRQNGVVAAGALNTNGSYDIIVGPVVEDSDFHHYAYVRSGNQHTLFMDGQEVANGELTAEVADTSGVPMTIGAFRLLDESGFCCRFAGVIDEVEVFNRALSGEEIRAIYDAGSAGKIKPEPPQSGLIVTKTGDTNDGVCDADCSLREAIAAADSGDTIIIPGGTYTLTLGSQLTIDKSLTVGGAGSEGTVIQSATEPGVAFQRVFVIESGATVTISGLTIRHGRVTGFGGGIHNSGTLTLTNSTVSDNIARDPFGGNGGGIFNGSAPLALTNSTVSGNTATLQGGGIFSNGTLTITNSTISGNSANESGGGALGDAGGTVTVSNTTISNNTASSRGGGIHNLGAGNLVNTIVSGNAAPSGPDCTGSMTSLGHNLIGNVSGCSFNAVTGDQSDIDPVLGLLQDNGGPTLTHALLPGSPAIDRIPVGNCGVATDQRGVARPQGAACDIGAYEAEPSSARPKIVFVSDRDGDNEIFVMNDDGSDQTQLTHNAVGDQFPAWSPDGRKIIFAGGSGAGTEIYVMDANGDNVAQITDNGYQDGWPAWSPDGTRIAFANYRHGNTEVFVMNADGTGEIRLTGVPSYQGWNYAPTWSADGTRIAFRSDRGGNSEVWAMDPDGTNQTNLTASSPAWDEGPEWSPDGGSIAFHSQTSQGQDWDVWVMNADGTFQTNLTNNPAGGDTQPTWSPDSARIAYASVSEEDYEIFTMTAGGDERIQLTDNDNHDVQPRWSRAVAP